MLANMNSRSQTLNNGKQMVNSNSIIKWLLERGEAIKAPTWLYIYKMREVRNRLYCYLCMALVRLWNVQEIIVLNIYDTSGYSPALPVAPIK